MSPNRPLLAHPNFDADDYAEAYGLDRVDFDAQDVHSVQDAAGRLNPGEWLEVSHEIETD